METWLVTSRNEPFIVEKRKEKRRAKKEGQEVFLIFARIVESCRLKVGRLFDETVRESRKVISTYWTVANDNSLITLCFYAGE